MSYLPKEVQTALQEAHLHMQRKTTRLTIHVGNDIYPVTRLWDTGFAIARDDAPQLRGAVDLFDGARYLSQCKITACRNDRRERVYEYDWRATALAPSPVDYVTEGDGDLGLMVRPD